MKIFRQHETPVQRLWLGFFFIIKVFLVNLLLINAFYEIIYKKCGALIASELE